MQFGLTENQNQPGFSYGSLSWSLMFCFQKQISLLIFTYEYPFIRVMCWIYLFCLLWFKKKKKKTTSHDLGLTRLKFTFIWTGGRIPFVSSAAFPLNGESVLMQGKNTADKAIHGWERVDGNKVWWGLFVCLFNYGDASFTQSLEVRTYLSPLVHEMFHPHNFYQDHNLELWALITKV